MAEEIIFKTSVDTGTTAKDLQAIDKELGNIDKTTKSTSTDLNKTFDDLNARVESGTLTMRESTQAIKQYQTIALQAGRESPIGKEALQRAGDLKDKLGDLKTEITNLGTDGANMKAALQLGSTITAGYGALTGAQALLGAESENLTKTLVKLQAVQAILASIEEVRAALEKESFLMQKAKAAQTWLLTTATGAYATVVGTSTGAMKLFKIALASTGIGLFIVALGAVVANFDKVKSKTQEVSAKFQEAYKTFANKYPEASKVIKTALEVAFFPITITIKSLEKLYDLFTGTTEASRKAQAVADANHSKHMTQLDEEQRARDENLKGLDRKIALLEAEGKSTIKLREEKIKLQKQEAEANLAFAQYMRGRMKGNEIFEQSFTDMVSVAQDSLTSIEVEEKKLAKEKKDLNRQNTENYKANLDQQKADLEAKNQADKEALDKKNQDELEAIRARYEDEVRLNQERISKEDAQYQLERSLTETQQEQELQDLINSYDEKFLIAEGNIELETKLQERLKTEIADINNRYRQEDVDAEKAAIEEKEKADRESQKRKIQIAQDYAGAVNNLAGGIFALSNSYGKQDEKSKEERAKRQFKVQKALNLGMAIIDGYKAITASLSQSPIAIGPVPNPAGIASLAFATATSIANVAKIASAKYEGGSLSGGGGTSVAPPTTVPNTPNPQLANADTTLTSGLSGNTNNQGGGKVFVVDSEITAKQNQTAQALNIATVG